MFSRTDFISRHIISSSYLRQPVPGLVFWWCGPWIPQWRKWQSQRTCWWRSLYSTQWWHLCNMGKISQIYKLVAIKLKPASICQTFGKEGVLPVNVVIEVIVAAQSNQRSQTQTIREEDLSSSIQPHLKSTERKYPFKFYMLISNIHFSISIFQL